MKFIHCADIHLDSAMKTHLSADKAFSRNVEITQTFERLCQYAQENQVRAVIIAGDLFDTKRTSRHTVDCVLDAVKSTPEVDYLYLRGNHDEAWNVLTDRDLPLNFKQFSDRWTTYAYEHVCIHGVEFSDRNVDSLYEEIPIQDGKMNIVVQHGQIGTTSGPDLVNLNQLKNRGIQYLALGHLHTYQTGRLDADGGVYCYPGCLEGRGFDECGKKGFVLLETEGGRQLTHTFLPFARRRLHRLRIDISGQNTTGEIYEKIRGQCQEIPADDMVEILLTGASLLATSFSLPHLEQKLDSDFYFSKIKDESVLDLRPEDYQNDVSLKGEFIRLVQASNETEMDKAAIIRAGLQALSGEEITL